MADTERVVVGGGVVGLAVARDLATDHAVTLLERDSLGGGATARAAGLVSLPADYGAFPAVVTHALDAFEAFDGTAGFRFHGSPGVERPSAGRGDLSEAADRLSAEGLDVNHVSAAQARDCYPRLATPAAGLLRFNRGGWLRPTAFAAALADDAVARGATLETGVTVTGVSTVGKGRTERVDGVETTAGHVDADAVVVAAGWRTAELLAPDVQLPVQPYRTQCVRLAADSDLRGVPMGWAPERGVYWRPTRDGELLVGGGSHRLDDPAAASRDLSSGFRERVASQAPALFEVGGMRCVNGWAGVDGATPDSYPIVDAAPEMPEGLVVATGFHGRGVMAAFPAAALVRSHLGGEESLPTGPFRLDRFSSRDRDFELLNVSA
jgi:glycine/D-amino acid oxidase-like deaminating enzyme